MVTVDNVHPEYRQILTTYFANLNVELVTLPTPDGCLELEQLKSELDDNTACVLIQHPNFFGCLEDMQAIADASHEAGALVVQSFDPISLGILKRPGDFGVDVAVAEGQSLGNPMAFGGPYLGIMACRDKFVRRMPGRIAGQTVDRRGKRCFVLTLQTREQHIRREKATSNICTNQGLFALRSTIYMSAMGPQGLKRTAELCLHKARYAADQLTASGRFELLFDKPTFKEFVIRDRENNVAEVLDSAVQDNIHAGVPLATWYPELEDCFLVAVTEKRTKADIDQLAKQIQTTQTCEVSTYA